MSYKRNTRTSQSAANFSSPVPKEHSLLISSINPYITCSICEGYLIDATTVIDCLHTFCKSCLLKYFEDNTDCPKCHFNIHQSHPSHYVAFDRTIQDIVYKLVPGLQAEEIRRREEFRKKTKTIDNENCRTSNDEKNDQQECCSASENPALDHHRRDESVFLNLVPEGKLNLLDRSFVRISGLATINTIRKYLAYVLYSDIQRYTEFDLYCNNELMGRDFSMAFIYKTRWRNKSPLEPLCLTYKEHIDF